MDSRLNHDLLPEYVETSVGQPDFGSIANRLRELAALLAAQDCEEAAEHLTRAYGCLLGVMVAQRPAVAAAVASGNGH